MNDRDWGPNLEIWNLATARLHEATGLQRLDVGDTQFEKIITIKDRSDTTRRFRLTLKEMRA